ncbi:MAG TPA: hypothetical protein VM008_19175 [Phycisphaerae bacterium]|nr:hypothetical protein [Phycisphaerae bacterium]
MGYDLRITRKHHETEVPPISLDEWIALVDADPELRLDGRAQVQAPDGSIISYENPGLAIWTPNGVPHAGNWFDYRRGRIVVKNPDENTIAKMKQLAAKLQAKVIGDEGEEY